jgi:hypothetical protein
MPNPQTHQPPRTGLWIYLILLLSLVLHTFHLAYPAWDYHNWRQTITLMVARDFAHLQIPLKVIATLESLDVRGSPVTDLKPVQGMLLTSLASDVAYVMDGMLQGLGTYNQRIHVLSEMNKTIACTVEKAERLAVLIRLGLERPARITPDDPNETVDDAEALERGTNRALRVGTDDREPQPGGRRVREHRRRAGKELRPRRTRDLDALEDT